MLTPRVAILAAKNLNVSPKLVFRIFFYFKASRQIAKYSKSEFWSYQTMVYESFMDMTESSECMKTKFRDSDGRLAVIDNYEKLTSGDFAQFAKKAMDRRLYHVAIEFAKESLRLHKIQNEGIRAMTPNQYKSLKKIKELLMPLNNE